MKKGKRILRAVTGGLILCLLCSAIGLYGQAEGVRDSVVRLHILANSDSTQDQTIKLKVRDAVTAAAAGWLDGATDTREALEMARLHLPHIRQVAEQTVAEAGADYPVAVELNRAYFTTRQYDRVTLPAGMYDAVRITLGEGAGQNWWCVVFPPFCAGAAAKPTDLLTSDQQEFLSQGPEYTVKFKVVEWFESFLQIFR